MKIPAISQLCLALLVMLNILPSSVFSHGDSHEEYGGYNNDAVCMPYWSCFNHPACTPEQCLFSIQWRVRGDEIQFNLTAITTGYIAVGISTSGKMAYSEVYSCNNKHELHRGWNSGGHTYNPNTTVSGTVSGEHVTVRDGMISCQFQRVLKLDNGPEEFLDLTANHTYTVLAALKSTIQPDGHPAYHGDKKWKSEDKVDFTAGSGGGRSEGEHSEFLPKLHGVLMTLAWLGFAAIGITSSRYYKPIWPETTLWGKPVWFSIHRTCMVAALLCFLFAAVVIVIHVGSYIMPSEGLVRFLHAVFGTTVIVLGICNWLMALFRPHPGTPNRPIYNWAHWSVGTVAFYLALATILLGIVDYPDRPLLGGIPNTVFWVTVIFIMFHIVVWGFLQYITVFVESKGRENDVPLVDDADEMEKSPINGNISTSTSARLKQMLLWVYMTGVIITVLVVVIGIIIAKEED